MPDRLRKDVIAVKDGHVAILALNRPPANLVNRSVLAAIGKAVEGAVADPEVRVIVVTGSDIVFSEGIDLESFPALGDEDKRNLIRLGQDVILSIEQAPQPTIAAIAGKALGAGLELALACDMRLASEDAQFGHPEVTQGLIPLFGTSDRLERLIGFSRSRSLIFTGEPIPAWEALEIGLVGKVAPHGAFLEAARIAAARIANQPVGAARAAKRMMLRAEKGHRKDDADDIVKSISKRQQIGK